MKKTITILVALFIWLSLAAQAPEKMSYQAVVRNEKGALVLNRTLGMKYTFAIPKPYYTTIYAETHTPVTNENGLVSIAIGTGTLVPWSIPFKDINWGAETYYLRTDIDLSGGSTYTISSTQQLLSVPYSLTSKTAVKADTASKAAVADMAKKNNGEIILWIWRHRQN